MKRTDIFDLQNFFFDDEGFPHFRSHTCGRCGYSCQPEEQMLMVDDNEMPEGVVASTRCPGCDSMIMSAAGVPEFMSWIIQQPHFTGDDIHSCKFQLAPIAGAVAQGVH